ncbi:MAG: globin domain-containing protein [Gammaproteobacteria bacterium]|nr:globin domain-containing protein [Gammaproteobacteria bacterium]
MNAEQIQRVQASWQIVKPISEQAADLFYTRLFELDPSLKALFKSGQAEQGRKLMAMLNTAVIGLTNLEAIVPVVQNLGRSHVAYGVKDEHYDTVGEALIWTLAAGLGEQFTDDVKDAWLAAYMLLATTMKEAAQEVDGVSA